MASFLQMEISGSYGPGHMHEPGHHLPSPISEIGERIMFSHGESDIRWDKVGRHMRLPGCGLRPHLKNVFADFEREIPASLFKDLLKAICAYRGTSPTRKLPPP